MDKPLPCPFCGAAPVVGPKDPEREGNAIGTVNCQNKECWATVQVTVYQDREPIAEAIRQWNRRDSER